MANNLKKLFNDLKTSVKLISDELINYMKATINSIDDIEFDKLVRLYIFLEHFINTDIQRFDDDTTPNINSYKRTLINELALQSDNQKIGKINNIQDVDFKGVVQLNNDLKTLLEDSRNVISQQAQQIIEQEQQRALAQQAQQRQQQQYAQNQQPQLQRQQGRPQAPTLISSQQQQALAHQQQALAQQRQQQLQQQYLPFYINRIHGSGHALTYLILNNRIFGQTTDNIEFNKLFNLMLMVDNNNYIQCFINSNNKLLYTKTDNNNYIQYRLDDKFLLYVGDI